MSLVIWEFQQDGETGVNETVSEREGRERAHIKRSVMVQGRRRILSA